MDMKSTQIINNNSYSLQIINIIRISSPQLGYHSEHSRDFTTSHVSECNKLFDIDPIYTVNQLVSKYSRAFSISIDICCVLLYIFRAGRVCNLSEVRLVGVLSTFWVSLKTFFSFHFTKNRLINKTLIAKTEESKPFELKLSCESKSKRSNKFLIFHLKLSGNFIGIQTTNKSKMFNALRSQWILWTVLRISLSTSSYIYGGLLLLKAKKNFVYIYSLGKNCFVININKIGHWIEWENNRRRRWKMKTTLLDCYT